MVACSETKEKAVKKKKKGKNKEKAVRGARNSNELNALKLASSGHPQGVLLALLEGEELVHVQLEPAF